ncbi:MAG: hypothetical protein ACE5GB_15250, partial [Acidimicrobiales bacterium]
PAPRANPFWRFVFPLLVVGAGVAVYLLFVAGTKSVLDSTDGRVVVTVLAPDEPGYQVFIDPTPTMLVAHTDGGELVGVTVLAQNDLDQGGSAVLLSSDLILRDLAGGDQSLTALWSKQGIDGLAPTIEGLFGFGFTETLELDTQAMASLMRLAEPISYRLTFDLVTESSDGSQLIAREQGSYVLSADELAELYAFRNPGEADANRVLRQRAVWDAWLTQIELAGVATPAVPPFPEGISPYLESLGLGAADVRIAPLEPVDITDDDPPAYIVGAAGERWFAQRAREMVPLPISPLGVVRPSIRLLDGAGDPATRDAMIEPLVASGGVISVIGNAETFDMLSSTVAYHRAESAEAAERIAADLDLTAVFDDDPEQPIDLTVTIGLDRGAS